MSLNEVTQLAENRRKLRWKKERAAQAEGDAHRIMVHAIAAWKGVHPSEVRITNIACTKAPVDLNCTFVEEGKYFAKCVFCKTVEDDGF